MSNTTTEHSHARCNGISDETVKSKCAIESSPPNGVHVLPKSHIDVKAKEPHTILLKQEAGAEAIKTTNELIDKLSTDMALSLIHSNSKNQNDESTSDAAKVDPAFLLKNNTPSICNSAPMLNSVTTEVDTTVEFPISKTVTGNDYVVAIKDGIKYLRYESERQMSSIMQLITKDLSEPYSIYTYRYFIHNWPHLCFLAMNESEYVGAIVCKLDLHKKNTRRGYIAMLAVDKTVRRRNIGTSLVKMAIETMHEEGCDEVVLETEVTNKPALKLYENLGFVRDKRLFRYYLNGVDALRLKLWLR